MAAVLAMVRRLLPVLCPLGHSHQKDHAESVVGGEEGRREGARCKHGKTIAPELGEDLLLAEESSQRRNPGQSRAPDHQSDRSEGHPPPSPAADLLHVVGLEVVDVQTGTEKEQRLEDGVGDQVEIPGKESASRQGHQHEAQLADG